LFYAYTLGLASPKYVFSDFLLPGSFWQIAGQIVGP